MFLEFRNFTPLEDVLPLLDGKKLVSCEVLGGLLETDFQSFDAFHAYMELWSGIPDFAHERRMAEQIASADLQVGSPLTLQQIYANLPLKMEHERQMLRATARPIGHVLPLYEACVEKGVGIIALCDTPHDSDFLKELLHMHGFHAVQEVITSSETGRTKKSYEAFRHLLRERSLEPGEVLHFGGDDYSDYGVPRDIGMDTLLVVPDWQALSVRHIEFKEMFERLRPFLQHPCTPTDALLPAMVARTATAAMAARNFPEALPPGLVDGVALLGPVLAAFTTWVSNRLANGEARYLLLLGVAAETRLFEMLREQFRALLPEMEIIPLNPASARELPPALRQIPLAEIAIVNLDPTGAAVGKLVAHLPPVASQAVFHLYLGAESRSSPHDVIYLSRHGIPEELSLLVERLDFWWQRLRDATGSDEECQICLEVAQFFLREHAIMHQRYAGLPLTRRTLRRLAGEVGDT